MTTAPLPLVEELLPAPEVSAALSACEGLPGLLLFESALRRAPVGRYSFLLGDPWLWIERPAIAHGQDVFGELREAIARFPTSPQPGFPPFLGGAAGLLSYDAGRAWERLPGVRCDEFQLPALAVGLYDWVLAWDHLQQRAWIVSQGFPETEPRDRQARAQRRLLAVRERLAGAQWRESPAHAPALMLPALPREQLSPQFAAPGLEGLTSNFSKADYLRAVRRAVGYIHAGDVFQVNLSQRLLHPQQGTAVDLYQRLRTCNPAPFAGFLQHGDWAVVSASPERFACVRDGEVETRPIKGTLRRGAGPEADLFTRDALRESDKDQAENIMIVDLLRNDLSRVCAPGSIKVRQLCQVETYETVQHLVSEVRGRLAPGRTAWDLLAAAFPGGSVTGAPKVRAMQIIDELEPTARGPYCGSLFYVGGDGTMDSNILIRTFTVRKGWVQCPVGGGIVADSDPESEYLETLHKAEGMLRALR